MKNNDDLKSLVDGWIDMKSMFKDIGEDLICVSYYPSSMYIQLTPSGFAKLFTEWKTEENGRWWQHSSIYKGVQFVCLNTNEAGPFQRGQKTASDPLEV